MPPTGFPFYPIIYLRGFAPTVKEINATTADPFNGFNMGSIFERDGPNKRHKYIFESPVIRLISEYGYNDSFIDGHDIRHKSWNGKITNRSIIIFRYYEDASKYKDERYADESSVNDVPSQNLAIMLTESLKNKRLSIKTYAEKLGELIDKIRNHLYESNKTSKDDFRCYLVAHSMGGIICRTFLHNDEIDKKYDVRKCVDKVFTYGTPHNGIEDIFPQNFNLLGLQLNNFNRKNMAEYLNVKSLYNTKVVERSKRVDWLISEYFPAEKFFCLIGTNHLDYDMLLGIPRTLTGRYGSDGLVKIENASLIGVKKDGSNINTPRPCPKAFVNRSHSGDFGLVNSEESYRNLVGFLFGKFKVEIGLDIDKLDPPNLENGNNGGDGGDGGGDDDSHNSDFNISAGDKFDALYKFEVSVSERGQLGFLTRRLASENSAESVTYKETKNAISKYEKKEIYLSTIFIGSHNPNEKSEVIDLEKFRNRGIRFTSEVLAFSVKIEIPIPSYEWNDIPANENHFEGTYLFRDTLIVEMTQSRTRSTTWDVNYRLQTERERTVDTLDSTGKLAIRIPLEGKSINNIAGPSELTGTFWLNISRWNNDGNNTSLSSLALAPEPDNPLGSGLGSKVGLSQ